MANNRSGPVRPPTLDLEARRKETQADATTPPESEADAPERDTLDPGEPLPGEDLPRETVETPEPESSEKTARPANPVPQPPQRPRGSRAGRRALLVLGGGILGLALAYGLAALGYWPGGTNLGPYESRLAALEARAPEPVPEGVSPEALAAVEDRVAALESAPAPDANTETEATLAMLAEQVDALEARLAALVAAGPEVDSETVDALAGLSRGLEAAQSGLADLTAQVDALDQDLDQRIGPLEAALAEQPTVEEIAADRDRFAQWPPALAALRGSVAAGAPFATELAAVRALAPDLQVPQDVVAASGQGVDDLATLNQRFAARIPDMLRARPENPDAPWVQQLLDQAGAALALRPAGDIEGEGSEAELARAEAALEAGDLEGALAALSRLPEPMQAAAGDLPQAIARRAQVEAFLAVADGYGPRGSGEPQE